MIDYKTHILRIFTLFAVLFSTFAIANSSEGERIKSSLDEWEIAYLASFPRSGNTWMRQLIHMSAGILTSSVYQHNNPFSYVGESPIMIDGCYPRPPHKNELVLVKTHHPDNTGERFKIASHAFTLRIVRHPIDTIYSFYSLYIKNRPQLKCDLAFTIPQDFLEEKVERWKKFQEYWNKEPGVITIRYEDLYNSPEKYLKLILEKLNYSFTDQDIKRAVIAFSPRGGFLKHIVHYSDEQLQYVEKELGDLLEYFDYEIKEIRFPEENGDLPVY